MQIRAITAGAVALSALLSFYLKTCNDPSLISQRELVKTIMCRKDSDWNSSDPLFLKVSDLSIEELRAIANSVEKRNRFLSSASKITREVILSEHPLTLWEHTAAVLMLAFGPPNCVFTIPVLTFLIGYTTGNIVMMFQVLLIVTAPLAIWPLDFVPARLQSWPAQVLFRYFSLSMIMEEQPPTHCIPSTKTQRPTVVAAYPHGVFPYGSMLTVMSWPLLTGHFMRGLAANAALRTPVLRQCLEAVATVNASRASARAVLDEWPHTLGVSPGGVAEVFLANEEQPTILLKERLGIIKLAIRTGADIVPAYMFGNEVLYSCWMGEGIPYLKDVLEYVSRRVVGFATVLIWGRWLLPIPYRIPLVTVIGKPIPTSHLQCEEPSLDQMKEIQRQLGAGIAEIFDRYKHLYGMEEKKLVIT